MSRKVTYLVVSAFITCKPNQSSSYMKFTQGSSFLNRQFGSRKRKTLWLLTLLQWKKEMSANLQNKQKLRGAGHSPPCKCCGRRPASSFTDSSRRSRFCTSSATTCPSTCASGKQEKGTCLGWSPKRSHSCPPSLQNKQSKQPPLVVCRVLSHQDLFDLEARNSRPHYP